MIALQLSLLALAFFFAPLALSLFFRTGSSRVFTIVLQVLVMGSTGAFFVSKLYGGIGFALCAIIFFLAVFLYSTELSPAVRVNSCFFIVSYSVGAGMLLGDSLNYRIRDFSDDFSGGIVGLAIAMVLIAVLGKRIWQQK